MQIPEFLYGRYKDVKARCRRKVSAFCKGAPWSDLAGDMIDTTEIPGLLVIDGPYSQLGSGHHFRCFVLTTLLIEAMPDRLPYEAAHRVVEESLNSAWGVLGLLGQRGQHYLYHQEHHIPFLQAALGFWDDFTAEGERFTRISTEGKNLASVPTTLTYVLVNQGLPNDVLLECQTPQELAEMIRVVLEAKGA